MKDKDDRMKTYIVKVPPLRFIQILNCEGYKQSKKEWLPSN